MRCHTGHNHRLYAVMMEYSVGAVATACGLSEFVTGVIAISSFAICFRRLDVSDVLGVLLKSFFSVRGLFEAV
eukprot:m.206753 g.206753  ORF g.206753 m.206753 type:complete len:73 (+) comp32966_c0_seq2:103-321(+)